MFENCLTQQVSASTVALLIDGENITSALAGKIIEVAGRFGELMIKRVYGNATKVKGWDTEPGVNLVHSGSGKNAADIVLALDAVELSYDSKIDVFVLASSDGDFWHVATRLRERGFKVIGLGENKAPDCFRKSCSSWVAIETLNVVKTNEIASSKPIEKIMSVKTIKNGAVHWEAKPQTVQAFPHQKQAVPQPAQAQPSFDYEVFRIVGENPQGISTSDINKKIRAGSTGKISEQKQKTWASYFKARREHYEIDKSVAPNVVRSVHGADSRIASCIGASETGFLISQINTQLVKYAGVKLADVKESSWRQYFRARPSVYSMEGDAQATRIKLKRT